MAAAYRYAEGDGPKPQELIQASYIDRFGVQAVMGRQLGAGEMRRMIMAENIVNAYHNRQRAADWVKWAEDYPDEAVLLNYAMKAAQDG